MEPFLVKSFGSIGHFRNNVGGGVGIVETNEAMPSFFIIKVDKFHTSKLIKECS